MVKCGVFFAVRTEFLNSIYTRVGFKGLKMSMLLQTALAAETSGSGTDLEVMMCSKNRVVSDWPRGYAQTNCIQSN
jgi:hypothetical protein